VIPAVVGLTQPIFNDSSGQIDVGQFSAPLVPYDDSASAILGLEFTELVLMPITFTWTTVPMADAEPSVATASGRYGVEGIGVSRYVGHSRWYDEGSAEPPDPVITSLVSAANTAGTLTGVSGIWAPRGYRNNTANVNPRLRTVGAGGMTSWYAADFTVTWGASGTVTIRDQTHHVTLPHRATAGSGYGFITLANILAGGATQTDMDDMGSTTGDGFGTPDINVISYKHLYFTEPFCSDFGLPCSDLSTTGQISALDTSEPPDGVSDGNGFVLQVNGEQFFFVTDAFPAEGTEWHLRAVNGKFGAECTPALGPVMTDCDSYTFVPGPRASIVPGLNYNLTVEQQFTVRADSAGDLDDVHTVPDPYYVTTNLEATQTDKLLQFVNLPNQAIIRIYSLSGILVSMIEHNDPAGGGTATWNLRNRNSQVVASGVYFYHVESATGQEKVSRFTVVNFAQ
jgi:hypothetical protein